MSDFITAMKQLLFNPACFEIDDVSVCIMKTGQLNNSLNKNFQGVIKRQNTSQKSFISFFNTLSIVKAPPNPAIKNDIITALFTT